MKRKLLPITISTILLSMVYILFFVVLPAAAPSKGSIPAEENIVVDFTDKVVVVDSGHGGIDSGKVSAAGIMKKDINLAIAYKLKSLLEDVGIKVIMTRTDDNGLYQESDYNKKVANLEKRCKIIDDSNADLAVSIHQNDYLSSSVSGAQMFYYTHSAKGKKIAEIMQETFTQELNSNNKRAARADSTYYMLLHNSAPTVIAECGFLSNAEEAAKLNTEEYQQKVAQTLYDGIIKYFTDD